MEQNYFSSLAIFTGDQHYVIAKAFLDINIMHDDGAVTYKINENNCVVKSRLKAQFVVYVLLVKDILRFLNECIKIQNSVYSGSQPTFHALKSKEYTNKLQCI